MPKFKKTSAKHMLERANILQADFRDFQTDGDKNFNIRCPHCRAVGNFRLLNEATSYKKKFTTPDLQKATFSAGEYVCPNDDCIGIIYIADEISPGRSKIVCPPETTDFDPKGLPENIVALNKISYLCNRFRAEADRF